MKTAISYLRFSSKKQSSGDSYRRQMESTEKFCKANNLTLAEQRLEDLGVSAWTGKNLSDESALGGFLTAVEMGKIPKGVVLVIENLDRLSRAKILDAMSTFTNIIKNGIDIVTTMDGKWYSKKTIEDNPTDLMISIIYLTRGNNESETKSNRLKESWLARHGKIAKGEFAKVHCPSWITKLDKKYVLINDNAEIVKIIFDLYIKGFGASTLIQELEKLGIKSFTKTKKWNLVFIHDLLKNPAVIGTYENIGISIPNYYPACVSEEIYYQAIAQRKTNNKYLTKTISKDVNIFAGLCKCHKCGGNMIIYSCNGTSKNTKDKRYKFLICANSKVGRCMYEFTPYDKLNEIFLLLLNNMDFSKLLFVQKPTIDKSEALRNKITDIEGRITRVEDAIEKSESPTMMTRLTKLEIERKLLEKQYQEQLASNLGKVDVEKEYRELIHHAGKKMKDNNFRLALRNLMRKYITKIVCSADKFHVCLTANNELVSVTLNKPKLTPFGKNASYSLDFGKWNPDETPAPIIPLLPVKKIPNKSLTKQMLKAKGILQIN